MYKIISIENSKYKTKRFKADVINYENNEIMTFNFGDKNGNTYIDHKEKLKRYAYYLRHYNNPLEKDLIDKLTMSNAILSLFLLWGKYDNINDNINYYNDYISKKKKFNKNMIF
jgi:hypothetical protein